MSISCGAGRQSSDRQLSAPHLYYLDVKPTGRSHSAGWPPKEAKDLKRIRTAPTWRGSVLAGRYFKIGLRVLGTVEPENALTLFLFF